MEDLAAFALEAGDDFDGVDNVRHAETPELAREALVESAMLIFKSQVRHLWFVVGCFVASNTFAVTACECTGMPNPALPSTVTLSVHSLLRCTLRKGS